MAASTISGSALDDYLNTPDCPQCGSDDVECISSTPDGMGGFMKVWKCLKCGHVWTTHVAS
ncbi:MAG: hypothetical protein PUD09_06020 [Coriobacteriales bacterium]|nr:hypothetical protein [Coriobacteriales bacterium]